MSWWRMTLTLTVRDVCRITGLNPKQVSTLIEAGELTTTTAAGVVLIHTESVIERFGMPRGASSGQLSRRTEEALRRLQGCRLMGGRFGRMSKVSIKTSKEVTGRKNGPLYLVIHHGGRRERVPLHRMTRSQA